MIKANELRIGNYVYWNYGFAEKAYGKIYSVEKDRVAISEPFKNEDESTGQGFMLLKGIFPIKLTTEILEKCGFKKTFFDEEPDEFSYYSLKLFSDKGDFYESSVIKSKPPFKEIFLDSEEYKSSISFNFVHQLQNLFFALSGEELEIKL